MASMFAPVGQTVRLLDAGAGVGSLTTAAVGELLSRRRRPRRIEVTAYEVDPVLADVLNGTLKLCADACDHAGVEFSSDVFVRDFVDAVAEQTLLSPMLDPGRYTHAILNPPYFKIAQRSKARRQLEALGIEVPNIM